MLPVVRFLIHLKNPGTSGFPVLYTRLISTSITNCKSTQITNQQSKSTIWKSNSKQEPESGKKQDLDNEDNIKRPVDRSELLRRMEHDFSHIQDETLLFEISNPFSYRVYFIIAIGNLIFWICCADMLYMFYNKLSTQDTIQQRKQLFQQTKHDMDFWSRIKEYFSLYGYKELMKWTFGLIGIGSTLVFTYMLSRCVYRLHLMPGGKHLKIEMINWRGGINTKPMVVPLKHISTRDHRTDLVHFINMHLKNRKSSLLIDRQGMFPNEALYDLTVGVKRNIR